MKTYFIQNRNFTKSELEIWAWRGLKENDGWEKSHQLFILQWLAAVEEIPMRTSGTTAIPKVISLSKKAMEASAKITAQHFGIEKGATALLCLPSAYIAGKMMITRALVNGWHLLWEKPSMMPAQKIESIIDFVAMTPQQVGSLIENSPQTFSRIRNLLIGGSPVNPKLEEQLQKIDTRCFESYAMTETATHVATRKLNGEGRQQHFYALPGFSFDVDDRSCLRIDAGNIHLAQIQTNDIVSLKSNTEFQFQGRADFVINSAGIKIFPEAVESRIASLLPNRFFITSKQDVFLGQKVVLIIESQPWKTDEIDSLNHRMRLNLQPYEVPKEIIFESRLSETPSGKMIRSRY